MNEGDSRDSRQVGQQTEGETHPECGWHSASFHSSKSLMVLMLSSDHTLTTPEIVKSSCNVQ